MVAFQLLSILSGSDRYASYSVLCEIDGFFLLFVRQWFGCITLVCYIVELFSFVHMSIYMSLSPEMDGNSGLSQILMFPVFQLLA